MPSKPIKPLGKRAYGSIPHLPGSRRGPSDIGLSDHQAAILTTKSRPGDRVIVEEKLDGSCVAILITEAAPIALIRAGYRATDSHHYQHHLFAQWVDSISKRLCWLHPGDLLCGEWLAQAHGTRYDLNHRLPFVLFDLFHDGARQSIDERNYVAVLSRLAEPKLLWSGPPCSIETAMEALGEHGHYGAMDRAEGAVWRVENPQHGTDIMGKYVRPGKQDGCYLPEVSGAAEVWNWKGAGNA